MDENVRHNLTPNQFLSKYCVRFYLHDVTQQLLTLRTDKPLEFISKYFKNVRNGTNVINRDFNYINNTARNRCSFVSLFEHTYSNIPDTKVLTCDEFHQLILLLCSDFPESLVQIAYRILTFVHDSNISGQRPTFKQLKQGLRIYFFFREFFNEVLNVVFEHDTNVTVNVSELKDHLKKFCDVNLQAHLNSQYDNYDKRDSELKHMTPCYPSFEYFQQLLQNVDDDLSFNDFCRYIFLDLSHDVHGDIIRAMDLRCTPFTDSVAKETHQTQRKNIAKVLYFAEKIPEKPRVTIEKVEELHSRSRSNSSSSESSEKSSGRAKKSRKRRTS